jgi:hypothetical protein
MGANAPKQLRIQHNSAGSLIQPNIRKNRPAVATRFHGRCPEYDNLLRGGFRAKYTVRFRFEYQRERP